MAIYIGVTRGIAATLRGDEPLRRGKDLQNATESDFIVFPKVSTACLGIVPFQFLVRILGII
jgi:hypothetical protein